MASPYLFARGAVLKL